MMCVGMLWSLRRPLYRTYQSRICPDVGRETTSGSSCAIVLCLFFFFAYTF